MVVDNNLFNKEYANADNKKIIKAVCKKFANIIDTDELIRCGMIGLWRALRLYSDEKKTKFTTFLYHHVQWECLEAVRTQSKQKAKDKKIKENYIPPAESIEYVLGMAKSVLSDHEQSVINNYYVGQLTLSEMSQTYRRPILEIKNTINTALDKIRCILE